MIGTILQATAKLAPELWKPANGIDMRNDTSCRGRREVDPCMIVTKNSSYVMSCSGGMVSVFKTPTFQVRHEFLTQRFVSIYFLLAIVISPVMFIK